ncbi:MAG: hypothetical protein JRH08_16895 [Deltaproteobacteria bacterium]|nr:hypothetical protein [Deltaproteobacteria bacterium]MBW1928429.1 hypothetical protein [Deltaproteobacteria bacterium]MBW2024237.1 hypothetical protein [Deltaproteobacteria bacterium]MBW2127290.1 hypothetical protein [Deltaproteobacteria bacterium]RLB20561.1 MAG: hypothetical protein DRG76_10780 [Deltaproteobacteria bacterium]
MSQKEIQRKSLDNQEFLKLRGATEKISEALARRLNKHLNVLRPLFIPRRLLGTFVKSGTPEEVAGSDKAFAELQERYAAIAQKPFGLPTKLQAPLAPIPNQLEAVPFQYPLRFADSQDKYVTITSPCRWVLSYHTECSLPRLKAMLDGSEARQQEEMKQSLIHHLCMVIFLDRFPALAELIEDLRYKVETTVLEDLGGLPVVTLRAPVDTFLPPDDFILQVTQLSGIPAFQEIINLETVNNLADPLRDSLKGLLA